jgi:hypothetical protein
VTRRLTTLFALAVLIWTIWTMTTSPNLEHPDTRVTPATVAPAVTVHIGDAT